MPPRGLGLARWLDRLRFVVKSASAPPPVNGLGWSQAPWGPHRPTQVEQRLWAHPRGSLGWIQPQQPAERPRGGHRGAATAPRAEVPARPMRTDLRPLTPRKPRTPPPLHTNLRTRCSEITAASNQAPRPKEWLMDGGPCAFAADNRRLGPEPRPRTWLYGGPNRSNVNSVELGLAPLCARQSPFGQNEA